MATRDASLGTFIVACICSTLGMMVALGFTVFHVYHRNNRIVKMSSPNLNIVLSFGAIVMSATCFVYGLDVIQKDSMDSLSILCQIRVWLIVCSLTLLFGPVLVKIWRIHQIFKYGAVKRVIIKDYRLLAMVACLLAVDVLLLILWQTIDPLLAHHTQYTIQTVESGPSTSPRKETSVIRECICDHLEVWLSVLAVWKTVVAGITVHLAWKVRNVTIPALNDASHVIAAVFVTLIVAFVTSMTAFSLHETPDAVYIVTTLSLAACGILIQCILFLPKVYWWWTKPDTQPENLSVTSLKELDATPTPTNNHVTLDVNDNTYPGDGLLHIVEENKQLKHSLLEKEEFITALQGHLDTAKDKLAALPKSVRIQPFTGFDVDTFSNVTNDDDNTYDILRTPHGLVDRRATYKIEGTPRSDDVFLSDTDDRRTSRATNPKLKHSGSFQSISSSMPSFVDEFTDIRNSIGNELTSAKCLSSDLRDSLFKDVNRAYSETEWIYEGTQSKDLADSIAQSYDLGENRETLTYLNTYIPRDNNIYQVRRTTRRGSSSVISLAGSETHSYVSDVERDDVVCDIPAISRDSATPDSHTHAAILRCYSYRHLNDGFQRFKHSYKFNSDLHMQSKRNSRYDDAQSSNATFIEMSICTDDAKGDNLQPTVNQDTTEFPDSFV